MDNNSLKIISFSSPKGGVGRTLTLANLGKIYAKGEPAAAISSMITLLVDFDFNAPGLHYYDYSKGESNNNYIINKNNYSYKSFQNEIAIKEIGLIYLFSKIIKNYKYRAVCAKTIKQIKEKQKNPLELFRNFVSELFTETEFNPLNHLVQVNQTQLYFFPAGSIDNPSYENAIFNFKWLDFINNYLGIYLIDSIFIQFSNYILENNPSKPIRILIDQQAGISVPSVINRFLADASVQVSGFNEQNKVGLLSMIKNSLSSDNKEKPWVILNQYNLRDTCFDISTSIINSKKSPHSEFRKKDEKKRKDFVKNIINELQINDTEVKDKIFVTEFLHDAIQNEYFYSEDSISYRKLIEAVVNIEKYFDKKNNFIKNESKNYNDSNIIISNTIIVIGERVQLIDEPDKFYGPFYALLLILSDYFKSIKEDINIHGYAATHEQIAELSISGKINNIKLVEKQQKDRIRIFSLENGTKKVYLNKLDFISYPYYVKKEEELKKAIQPIKDIYSRKIETTDSFSYISERYLEKNIIGWKDYAMTGSETNGVPLFVMPQLLAFLNETVNRDSTFQKKFHRKYLRHFNGFNDPTDILNYAEVTKDSENRFKKILLCSSEQIAKFYEWQTISGIFNFEEHVNNINSKVKFIEYYFKEGATRAIQSYIKLFNLSGKTKKESDSIRDWDILLNEFFRKKDNSMIFLWADTIPKKYRKDEEFIYQLPPAFHYFEECWMLSAIKKDKEQEKAERNLNFIIHLMKKDVQQKLLEYGGLPVHKSICTDIDNWHDYPFLPHLWKSREIEKGNNETDIILKRKSFKGYYELGGEISKIFVDILNNSIKESLSEEDYYNEIVNNCQTKIIDLVKNGDDEQLKKNLKIILEELDENFPNKDKLVKHFLNNIEEKI